MTVVDNDMRNRLKAAADQVEETGKRYQLAVDQRNQLVGEAVDVLGMPQAIVAKLVRVSAPQVNRILGKLAGVLGAGGPVPA